MLVEDDIRMASIEEVVAMKLDVIQRGGRKKDFWDLHELLGSYSIEQMVALHAARFEYTHEPELIRTNFTNFTKQIKRKIRNVYMERSGNLSSKILSRRLTEAGLDRAILGDSVTK